MKKPKQEIKTQKLADIYHELLTAIKENPRREGLKKTPYRAAKALQFLTQGYNIDLNDIVRGAFFTSNNSEMVLLKDIELFSICEHHLLPIIGKCHVAYIPQSKIIGLSKIPRIVNMFARRLQVQENLTAQIAENIMKVTNAFGVGVVIEAEHLCMMARGVEKSVLVKTSSMLGAFRSSSKTRSEFLSLLA
ncbi:MAG: GTP cyclohydrolase I FolE [Coxiellaceae bacterium]|nr:GTP cyclohydrolase I FolE [Coxiellaceae bacterium]